MWFLKLNTNQGQFGFVGVHHHEPPPHSVLLCYVSVWTGNLKQLSQIAFGALSLPARTKDKDKACIKTSDLPSVYPLIRSCSTQEPTQGL